MSCKDNAIAIVGVACRVPGARSVAELADLLLSERDAVTEIPESRWSKRFYHDPDGRQLGKTYTFAAGCLDSIDTFDAGFFGMSPREAIHTDPQQRLLLELAYEAFEDAGWRPGRLGGRNAAVYVGASGWDYATLKTGDVALMDSHSMQGLSLSSLSNRISYVFNLAGPSLTIDTACSSALVALNLGCEALKRGQAEIAVVGAVNLLISPQNFVGFSRASMLSPTGRCHAFDARADGYVRSEGGGVVLLKPLAQALADGDAIRAVIHGSGVNSDGRTPGFSMPGQYSQAALLRRTYDDAGVDPESLCYLEAHGTGTPVGDPVEATALGTAIAQRRTAPLPIGSVKSNIGHLEAASGMAGLMKLMAILDRGEIPASLHCETPNPNIPFEALNLSVVTGRRPLVAGPNGVLLGVNSFGFGGTNAHAILGEPPARAASESPATPLPLVLSAKSEAALEALAADWADRLRNKDSDEAALLTRAAARAREPFPHRLVAPAGTPTAVAAGLDAWLEGRETELVSGRAVEGATAFVYAGNGSQWAGMGQDAYAHNDVFRATVAQIDEHFRPRADWSLARLFESPPTDDDLQRTEIAQPLLFALQVAATEALRDQGVEPAAVVGHSVGEAAAAWACRGLTLAEATEVIFHRSRLQQTLHGAGGMAVLNVGAAEALALIERAALEVEIAAINGPHAVTVAGSARDLQRLAAAARSARHAFLELPLAYAFHSRAMNPLQAPLKASLAGLDPHEPALLMGSTTTGRVVAAGELDGDYWWRNIRDPVLFETAIGRVLDAGCRVFVEVGPRPTLRSHIESCLKHRDLIGASLPTLGAAPAGGDPFPLIAARAHVAGADITGSARFDGPIDVRGLPTYPWQRQTHWLGSTPEAIEIVSPVEDHPLLGFRRDAAKKTWTNHLSTDRFPWIADHRVDGVPVLPAAAMIDIALAASQARENAETVEIEDLEVLRPLLVEGARELAFEVVSPGRFEISSRPRLSGEDRVVYARGSFAPPPTSKPRFRRAVGRSTGELDSTAFYSRIASLDIDYGPSFRAVATATQFGPDEVEVAFPVDMDDIGPGWRLDPRLLDAGFQALFATRSLDHTIPGDSILPWRFGRIRHLRPGSRTVRGVCRLKRIGPKAHCADFALLDEAGDIVVELLDCWFVRVRPGQAARPQRRFWRATTACARQPATPAHSVVPPQEEAIELEPSQSEFLAHIYAAAVAFETVRPLTSDNRLAPAVLLAEGGLAPDAEADLLVLLDWLTQEGLAAQKDKHWVLAEDSGLPPASEIWRTLFFDEPTASAELALAAMNAAALPARLRTGASFPQGALKGQLLEAGPTVLEASEALEVRLREHLVAWPEGKPLRIAVVGRPTARLLRSLAEATAASACRLCIFGAERLSPTLSTELRRSPGLVLKRGAFVLEEGERVDLLVSAFGLSEADLTPASIAPALAPGGAYLGVEPHPSRMWSLISGLEPPLQFTALADLFARVGLERLEWTPAPSTVWGAALLTVRAPTQPAGPAARPEFTLVTAGPSALAQALAEETRAPRLPLTRLAEAPLAQGDHLVTVAPDHLHLDDLADFCGGLARATANLVEAQARVTLLMQSGDQDPVAAALAGLARTMTNEGLDARLVHISPAVTAAQVLAEIGTPNAEVEVRLAAHGRTAKRLQLGLPAAPAEAGPRRLEINRPGLLASLAWETFQPVRPAGGEVAIQVEACGLNFRDVMWALGTLPDEALIDGFSGPSLGLECAGVVTAIGPGVTGVKTGDRVAALAPAALSTEVVTSASAVIPLPEDLDFAAAATLPVTALTVIYALGRLAQIEAGERVLIHGGLGGVGLTAIQFARAKGAEIYATAGSEERRAVLRALGVEHVYDSRSAAFADAILEDTGGEGVDVVLNSLSGELMQQSLKVLRPFGRFVEIGKRDLYANSQIGLRPLRHNISYFAVDADQLPRLRPTVAAQLLQEACALVHSGALRPLPHRVYDGADVLDAFRTMQGSGHIGKIVVRPARTCAEEPPAPAFTARRDRTYVVTGGAAGFGLETARWLAEHGAGSLALLSRQGRATPGLQAVLAEFAKLKVDARAYACDVSDEAQLAQTLGEIRQTQAPIGGVIHAAAVTDDALLKDLDAERFRSVLKPKLGGAMALDRLTREDPVELFVLYSSISSAIGNPGQGNYVAANAGMDAVARRRALHGLPALSVQWGPISDTGILSRDHRVRDLLERVMGAGDLTARTALDELPALLSSGLPVVGYAHVDWATLKRQLRLGETPLFTAVADSDSSQGHDLSVRDQVMKLSPEAARSLIETFLADEVSAILRLSRADIEVEQPISQMGFDSLMTLELHLAVESRLQCEIPVTSVSGGSTLRSIATRVVRRLQGEAEADGPDGDIQDLVMRHETLDDDDTLEPAE